MTHQQRYELIKQIAEEVNAENEALRERDKWAESEDD